MVRTSLAASIAAAVAIGSAALAQPQSRPYRPLTQDMLLRVIEEDVEAFVIWRQDVATVGVAIDKSNLTVYKPGRGLRYSLQTRLWEEVSPAEVIAAAAISWSQCMLNCIEEKLPGETAEQFIKA